MRDLTVCASVIFLGLAPAVAVARPAVIVRNPLFATPMPGIAPGDPASTPATCGPAEVGASAAMDWSTFANDELASITSWLTAAPDGSAANLVAVGGAQGGLVQVLAPQGTVTTVNRVSASVWVVAGQVFPQLGDGGSGGGATTTSTSTGHWEYVSSCGRPDMRNNEIVVYGVGPAVFYIRKVEIAFDPSCPSSAKR